MNSVRRGPAGSVTASCFCPGRCFDAGAVASVAPYRRGLKPGMRAVPGARPTPSGCTVQGTEKPARHVAGPACSFREPEGLVPSVPEALGGRTANVDHRRKSGWLSKVLTGARESLILGWKLESRFVAGGFLMRSAKRPRAARTLGCCGRALVHISGSRSLAFLLRGGVGELGNGLAVGPAALDDLLAQGGFHGVDLAEFGQYLGKPGGGMTAMPSLSPTMASPGCRRGSRRRPVPRPCPGQFSTKARWIARLSPSLVLIGRMDPWQAASVQTPWIVAMTA